MAEQKAGIGGPIGAFQRFLAKFEIFIAIIAFSLMLVDVIAGIILRRFLEIPFPWGEEVARYLMVTGILTGLGVCVREKAHLQVDLFRNMLPKTPQKAVEVFADLVTVACYGFLVIATASFIQKNSGLGQVSASLKIPIYYIYYILLLGFLLSLIEELCLLVQHYFLKPKKEREGE